MTSVYFLSAAKPLTKSFTLDIDGTIIKNSYPIVKNFTSHEEPITSLIDLYKAIAKHSKLNHCMLKGKLTKALVNEPRAGATKTTDMSNLALIDLDASPYKTPEDFMQAHPVLKNVSYIVQYSASQGIYKDALLSCHIFIMLDKPMQAPALKNWLYALNVENNTNKSALNLSRTAATLRYPIDVTTCQNDKLIYIAPPELGKGVVCKLPAGDRIQYIKKPQLTLKTADISKQAPEAVRKMLRTILDELRINAGYTKLTTATKWLGEYHIQTKPGEAQITGIKYDDDAGFVRFNLNGGDSWAYYHPYSSYEFIHSFKDPDTHFLTKELLPHYYKECKQEEIELNETPTEEGDLLLAFRDLKSANYWNGTWNAKQHKLTLHRAKDTTQLSHFLMANGRPAGFGDFVPVWRMEFNPKAKYIVNLEKKQLNTYVETDYLRAKHFKITDINKACPTIMKVIKSAVSGNEDNEILEFTLNWLAVLFQKRGKTNTALVLTGTYGTGKNLLVENIIRPLLGAKYVAIRRAVELEENWTGWLEEALVAFVDEIHIPASMKKDKIMADLFFQITGSTGTYRNMHSMSYEGPNYTCFIFSSNHTDPVKVEQNDRRFNFGQYQTEKLVITNDEIYIKIPKELQDFCSYLMTRKADVELAASIMDHQTRDNVIAASKTSLDEIGDVLKKGNLESLWNSMPDLNLLAELHGANNAVASAFANLVSREIYLTFRERSTYRMINNRKVHVPAGMAVCHSKLTRDELSVIFEYCVGNMPNTPNKFTSLLRHRGIVIEAIRTADNTARGIHVEWMIDERRLKEIHDQLEKKRTGLKVVPKAKVNIA